MRSLRIVAVATAAECVVPSLLRAFRRLHPEINLSLEVANRATLFERVLEHEVDVAIAGRPPDDDRIAGIAFLKNELALIAAPDRSAAGGAARRAPEQLGDRVWLMREPGSGTRQLVTEFLSEHELRPQTLTLGSNGAIKEAVRLGLGISLQSRVAVEHELATGTLAEISVRGGLPQRGWYALHSATVPPRPAVSPVSRLRHTVPQDAAPLRSGTPMSDTISDETRRRLRRRSSHPTSHGWPSSRDGDGRRRDGDPRRRDGRPLRPADHDRPADRRRRSATLVQGRGGILDVHLMIERPERHDRGLRQGGRRHDHGPSRGDPAHPLHAGLIRELGCRPES